MTEISFYELINKPITSLVSDSSQTQFRQVVLQILNPLSYYTLFLNPVAQDFPQLAEYYLEKIKYPISLKEIRQKLYPRNLRYYRVGEVFRDLVLLIENCREFNAQNTNILLAAAYFYEAVEEALVELCRKANAQTFSYDFLKQSIFDNDFAPFEQPKQAKMLDAKDFIYFYQDFNMLSAEKQGRALNMLVNELDDYEGGNCILEFTEENYKQFWWFNSVVQYLLTEKMEESEGEEEIEAGETMMSESTTLKDEPRQSINEV